MRKIRGLNCTHVDTERCLSLISQKLADLGVQEQDVISLQTIFSTDGPPMDVGRGHTEKANTTMYVYYWVD